MKKQDTTERDEAIVRLYQAGGTQAEAGAPFGLSCRATSTLLGRLGARRPRRTLEQRFWAKVDRSGGPDACWLWTGFLAIGYGQIRTGGRKSLAHRVSWELHYGPIPPGEGHHGVCVLHRCDVRACINPAHLWLGTNSDNMADMDAKGRRVTTMGEAHGNAKLVESQVLAIRDDPRALRPIAADYGVSVAHVSAIKRHQKWAYLS